MKNRYNSSGWEFQSTFEQDIWTPTVPVAVWMWESMPRIKNAFILPINIPDKLRFRGGEVAVTDLFLAFYNESYINSLWASHWPSNCSLFEGAHQLNAELPEKRPKTFVKKQCPAVQNILVNNLINHLKSSFSSFKKIIGLVGKSPS